MVQTSQKEASLFRPRFADFAWAHVRENINDTARRLALEQKAIQAGFKTTPDYIHSLQEKETTRSFVASESRTCWVNEPDGVYGWNNHQWPIKSTVIPARKAGSEFRKHKLIEAKRLNVDEIAEGGPLSEHDRIAPVHNYVRLAQSGMLR